MIKNKLFLKWWLIQALVVVASGFCYKLGVFRDVWENDNSYLSFVILTLFYTTSFWCGLVTLAASKYLNGEAKYTARDKEDMLRWEQGGWFASDQCLTIGMIGTVWGFIVMLKGFGNFEADSAAIQKLMDYIVAGMGTALYTTLVGLICGMILKLQFFNITHAIQDTPVALEPPEPPKKCCKKECKQGLNPFYATQSMINEKTSVDCGKGRVSQFTLSHAPILGTLSGKIYLKDLPLQTFTLTKGGRFLTDLQTNDPSHAVEYLCLDGKSVILTWSADDPGENYVVVNYEFVMEG